MEERAGEKVSIAGVVAGGGARGIHISHHQKAEDVDDRLIAYNRA